ncbi:hypothetical protein ABZ297_08965 [Nonomuraea sp. NPDC005983]|uniref:hypothetical protein n=1 Tax=Nonomuraea sp. NPDC005983 TaxID=3155595 RepID=UPI0033BD4708
MSRDNLAYSAGIEHSAERIKNDLRPIFTGLCDAMPDTDIPDPGFGPVGNRVLANTYHETQQMALDLLNEAIEVIDSWEDLLKLAAKNWRVAEDKGIVRYEGQG